MRVLVVEDDAHARRVLTLKLQERGHEVVECVSGEQALALHAAKPFPLLLLDWVLPGMDGLGLCRKLRSLSNNFSTSPVIVFTTARNSPYDLERGLDAGADDYLTKPIEPELLDTRLAIAERTVEERACTAAQRPLTLPWWKAPCSGRRRHQHANLHRNRHDGPAAKNPGTHCATPCLMGRLHAESLKEELIDERDWSRRRPS